MRKRLLSVAVFDYSGHLVCPIYDNKADVSGQGTGVHIKYSRNGWKELHFKVPTTCDTENGQEENFRLAYIIPDYKIRTIDEDGEDWFLITDESIKHEAFSKNVEIVAGHVSQLLKNRAMDLEFSDSEGNNVGTCKELICTVLEKTDWKPGKIATFFEDDGTTEKIRSLTAPVKSGAFKLIESICTLFEAKPVYRVYREDGVEYKFADVYPMNPFSELEPGEIPEAVYPGAENDERFLSESNVIELHYDKQLKTLERKRNTENIRTRLYAYGAYGDYVSKYCSIQTAKHDEYRYTISNNYTSQEFQIQDKDGVTRYFKATVSQGDELVWSMLDYASRRYVWNKNTKTAYKVYEDSEKQNYIVLTAEPVSETNYFPFLSDYSYYEDVGLLTDEMFQGVALFQQSMPDYYKAVIEAQNVMSTHIDQLSYVGVPKSGFAKLDVLSCEASDEGSTITLNWENHPYGIIYRSDYAEKEKNYFQWHVAQGLKPNGDPTSGPASIIYVLHDTDPIQWECAYLKDIDGRTYVEESTGKTLHDGFDYANSEGDKPKVIQVWGNISIGENDSVFLFCRNSISGELGAHFSTAEAIIDKLEDKTTLVTEKHPTYFIDENGELPEIDFETHGWCYKYDSKAYDTPGVLYFCWAERNDTEWKIVYVQDKAPEVVNGGYFYNTRYRTLWHGESGAWIKLETVEEQEVASQTSFVYMFCRQRDQVYNGIYEEYTYIPEESIPANTNCAVYTPFGYYYLFSTDQEIKSNQTLTLNTVEGRVYQDENVEHVVMPHAYPYYTVIFPDPNELDFGTYFEGSVYINDEKRNGIDLSTDQYYRSNYLSVWPNETYNYQLPQGSFVVLYDANRNYLSYVELGTSGSFSTAVNLTYSAEIDPDAYANFRQARYLRVVMPKGNLDPEDYSNEIKANYFIQLDDYLNVCFMDDRKYHILSPIQPKGDEPIGINSLLRKMKQLADSVYLDDLPALQDAQAVIDEKNLQQLLLLGDILREGWWQDGSYVDGDEERMYNDALSNLRKIAQPETSYSIGYIDLFGTNRDKEYSVEELNNIDWPNVKITDAAHLVDPDLKVNQWAYIDTLDKWFDLPWQSSIEINTQLTLIGQHEFKDVMTRIAEVASETKAKQTLYQRAEAISSEGTISAESLSGEINTEDTPVVGGTTGWKTDAKGNMVMESSDGLAALRFNGTGLSIANSKKADGEWAWKLIGSGFGIDANSITYGKLDGGHVKVNSIQADKLMANVGNMLDIGSNKALNLFATVDGVKPTGALKTTDAIIEIKAGSGEAPAVINVKSGGELNLLAGTDKSAKLNIESKGQINMKAGSEMNIAAESGIHIATGGTFSVESGNFNLDDRGNVQISGRIESSEGQIANWHIGQTHLGNNESLGESSVGLRAVPSEDDIIFWAGNKARNNAPFKVKSDGGVDISGNSSFVMRQDKTIGTETRSVENIIINNNGIRVGRRGETLEDINKNEYDFTVDETGHVTAQGITIKNATIEGANITDGTASMSNSYLSGGTLEDATVKNASIQGGSVEMKGSTREAFTVQNGVASIVDGNIYLGSYTEGEDEDEVTKYKATFTADGKLVVDDAKVKGTFSGKVEASENSTIGGMKSDTNGRLVANATGKTLYLNDTTYPILVGNLDANQAYFFLTNGGSVKCYNADMTNGFAMYAVGNAYVSNKLNVNGQLVQPSSVEYKENIKPLEPRAFDKLNPVEFNYKGKKEKRFGLIYEEVKDIYPEVCQEDGNGKSIAYLDFIAVLIQEVQELRRRVDELERRRS